MVIEFNKFSKKNVIPTFFKPRNANADFKYTFMYIIYIYACNLIFKIRVKPLACQSSKSSSGKLYTSAKFFTSF